MLWDSFLDKLGNTPIAEIREIETNGARIFIKLESENPSGSIKDRPAMELIRDGEKKGQLKKGSTILEPTSGNTGIALALIAKIKGYHFTAVMPENTTPERRALLELYGADIIFSPGEEGSNGAVRLAWEIKANDPSFYMPYQYGNEANPRAHYFTTAPEILRDLPDITTFVAGLGTGGTLMGCARYFQEEKPDVKIVASEPKPGEKVSGLRNISEGFIPPILDINLLDRKILISNAESVHYTRMLLEEEAIWTGVSTGANLAAALRVAEPGETILLIAPDDGWRYLSSGIYGKEIPDDVDGAVFW
jgi:cysteine synthase